MTLWSVSEARECSLRFTNVSPQRDAADNTPAGHSTQTPCTKIKLVALAVGAARSGNYTLARSLVMQEVPASFA